MVELLAECEAGLCWLGLGGRGYVMTTTPCPWVEAPANARTTFRDASSASRAHTATADTSTREQRPLDPRVRSRLDFQVFL
jgi:hypothetical protein